MEKGCDDEVTQREGVMPKGRVGTEKCKGRVVSRLAKGKKEDSFKKERSK